MNSPAVHSFSGPKLGNRAPVSIERNKELESRLIEMLEWRKYLISFMRDKRILQWMDFNIDEYADIIFATQTGNIHMNYNEESFDSGEKSVFSKQKESSLGDFEKFMERLGNAKDTFQTHSKDTLSLLDDTINIARMVLISKPRTVVSELQQSNHNYNFLREQFKSLFDARNILIDVNQSLSSFSLHTIANLINIRIFRNTKTITKIALSTFYRSEEVRVFLSGKSHQPKESPIAQYQRSLEEVREKIQELKGKVDALKRDTNFVICYEVLAPRYIETIAEQTNMVGEILKKYEKKIWKQEGILRKFNQMIESVDFSKDLLQVFVAMEHIAKEYGKNISLLSDGYNMKKGLEDIDDIIRKLNLLCVRIKEGLIEKLLCEYQSNPRFDLNPAVSVSKAIKDTCDNRGPLQRIYHALVRLVLEKDAFNEKLMVDIVASHNKTVSIDWQNEYKVSLHKSAEAKLFEYQKHPFYNEMVETLKKAFEIYIEKVEEYTKKFTDSRWSKGETQETIESLLEDIKERIEEKKK